MMLSEGKLSASEVVVGKTILPCSDDIEAKIILSCSDDVVGKTIGRDAIRSRCSPRSNYTEGHNV